jgi:hypothetical protein
MKNRKRESCTSGTVRDEDGNILIYSARHDKTLRSLSETASKKKPVRGSSAPSRKKRRATFTAVSITRASAQAWTWWATA